MMRFSASAFAISAALLMFVGDAVMAQTAAPAPMTKRALRQQDRDECSKQVTRYQADLFLECMANREAARKAAAKKAGAEEKKKAGEDVAVKREKAKQDWDAELKARQEWNQKRLELIKQEHAKRADCKKQAADQKLRFAKRLRFLETCIAAK
jgi:hypothetical protein